MAEPNGSSVWQKWVEEQVAALVVLPTTVGIGILIQSGYLNLRNPSDAAVITTLMLEATTKGYLVKSAIEGKLRSPYEFLGDLIDTATKGVDGWVTKAGKVGWDTMDRLLDIQNHYQDPYPSDPLLPTALDPFNPPGEDPFNGAPIARWDPLILDLDGDGIETTNISSGAYFDLDNNGFAEKSGWVNSDDGILVMDRNGDGIINDGQELFGDQTLLSNGQRATDGFQALADLDTNGDGKIDVNDSDYSNIHVWRDMNSDGYSSADELFTAEQVSE